MRAPSKWTNDRLQRERQTQGLPVLEQELEEAVTAALNDLQQASLQHLPSGLSDPAVTFVLAPDEATQS